MSYCIDEDGDSVTMSYLNQSVVMYGKCPYCEDGTLTMEKKPVRGVLTKVYSCSNVKVVTEDGECWEQVGSCTFTIFGNALSRYGKRWISPKEVKELLKEGCFIAELKSRNGQVYKKYVVADKEFGVSVLFDTEVEV